MATYQNPFLYGFSPWPTFDEDATTTGTTAGGITDAYIGGGGGGGAGGTIPILPRGDERDDYVWPLDSTIGTLGELDRLGGFKHGPTPGSFIMPSFSEIANQMLGREGATEAFAGGAGNVGSRAGLYPDEVANLNTVMQGGYLNANNTGQDIFGVNVVSAGGDYAKRQQEIKDFYDSKSEEEFEKLMKSVYHDGRYKNATNVVNANSAIVAAEKAATGYITKKDEREIEDEKRKTIVDAAASEMLQDDLGAVVPATPGSMDDAGLIVAPEATGGMGSVAVREMQEKAFRDLQAKHAAAAKAEATAQQAYHAARNYIEPPRDQGGRDRDPDQAQADRGGGSAYSSPFKHGGPVYVYKRKKYGSGGIVDLL